MPERGAVDVAGGVAIGHEPLDPAALLAAVGDTAAGGNVLFVGTARGVTAGVVTRSLAYDAHEPLARTLLEALRAEAADRFGLTGCGIAHRLGEIAAGEASVAIAATAPHRREAFAAAEWLMDRIKRDVPIWKCEEHADGRREWQHPDAAGRPGSRP
ncbi:MAG: molybdenum cofactor biosynthesis protein MoaE [Pirellulales bacterium]